MNAMHMFLNLEVVIDKILLKFSVRVQTSLFAVAIQDTQRCGD